MNKDWDNIDQKHVWHPFTPLQGEKNILIESAKDAYLFTADGRKIIDAISSWWVNIHGHSNEFIANAIYEQAKNLEHVIFAGFTHKPALQLAENLLSIIPSNQQKIFFSDNGSTAVEVALKMAFQYWFNKGESKPKVIALEGAYHGDTFGAMSVGARSSFTQPFSPYLFDVNFIDPPSENDPEASVDQFRALVKNGDVAAFIYEPLVQGAAGMNIYPKDPLDKILKIAKENQVVCIADEVMTGFGRTGKFFASDHLGTEPDIMCFSKGITGGTMALGVTSCASFISNVFESSDKSRMFFHGHSFTANPLSCAAANASAELLKKEETQKNIRTISSMHEGFLKRLQSFEKIKKARSLGTILSMEIDTKQNTSYFHNIRDYLYHYFLERNILMRPLGNIIYIIPPYCVTNKDLEFIYDSIEALLNDIKINNI